MRASALDKLNVKVKEINVKNHYVVRADGGEIPIRSRFNAVITSDGKAFGDSLIYVVDDSPVAILLAIWYSVERPWQHRLTTASTRRVAVIQQEDW